MSDIRWLAGYIGVMAEPKPFNCCQRCGCTSYKPVMHRNEQGVMAPSGQYKCVQCGVLFSSVREWRGDAADLESTSVPSMARQGSLPGVVLG